MLTTAQYKDLEERVVRGKAHLEGKWGNDNKLCDITREPEEYCVELWFSLSELLFEEQCRRGVFKPVRRHEEVMQSAEERLERIRQQMIAKGLVKPTKKGGQKRNVQTRSDSFHLFESS
jgi:hypothetical protein